MRFREPSNDNYNSFKTSIPGPPLTTTGPTTGDLRRDNPPRPPNYVNKKKSNEESTEQTQENQFASQLHRAIDSCSWQDLYHGLTALQDTPEKILPVLEHTDAHHQSTILHTAAWKAPPALTKFLLDIVPKNANSLELFTARDADGNTPLHLVCANLPITASGTVDILVMKRLAEAAPQVLHMHNSQGDTPLHMLVSSPICCMSVDDDDDDDEEATLLLSQEAVSCLLGLSEDICYTQDSTGATPLHTAIYSGANEHVLVQLMEVAPLVVKVPDARGMLPLHYAAAFGRTPLAFVELLVMAYPNAIREVTVNGDTPLHLLASNASVSMANLSTRRMDVDTEKMIGLLMGSEQDDDDDDDSDQGDGDDGKQMPLLVANAERVRVLCFLFCFGWRHFFLLLTHTRLCLFSSFFGTR
jgi:ankyrin repeat protein